MAPTTLLTGLLFYFGRLHATAMFQYFGVHFTVLDLTAQDYLVRSADGLPLPLILVVGSALLALWVHRLLLRALPLEVRRTVLRTAAPLAALSGAALVGLAIADVQGYRSFTAVPEARGLSLSAGVLLLAYAARLLRLLSAGDSSGPPAGPAAPAVVAEWGAVFVLVSIGLFWAVGSYAAGVGTGRAQQIEASLPTMPNITLYSEKSLGLEGPGITMFECTAENAAYQARYDGLRIIQQSGSQYLLLPVGWNRTDGPAILIPRSDTMRIEFRRVDQADNRPC